MEPYLTEHFANPSGMHAAARTAKSALEAARESVAELCGCTPREVVFTGGGSEGDNLAVKGAAWAARDHRGADGIITTAIEHKAVLGACDRLARDGFRVARVGADAGGRVDLDALAASLDERVAVVSVMLVNNETGIVQPLPEVGELVRDHAPGAVLHTDAVQAPSWLDLRTAAAAIVGLTAAMRSADTQRPGDCARLAELRDRLQAGLARAIPELELNGDPRHRVEGMLNCAFPGIEAETLLVALDQHEVYASSGSACTSGAIDASHVLLAMGLTTERARSSIRFSLGYATTAADVDVALAVVPEAVHRLVGAAA